MSHSHFPATVVEKLLYTHSGVMSLYNHYTSGGKVTLQPQCSGGISIASMGGREK
jgi:hypothetical protein